MLKINSSFHIILKLYTCCFLLFVLSSCYKNSEGCLDILASNYSIGADNACSNCCTYPKILLNVNHTFNGQDLILGQEYINNIGSRFIIREQQFFFGEIVFFDEVGNKIPIRDSIQLTSGGIIKTFIRDFTTIRATVASAEVGTAKYSGKLSKATFRLGLKDEISAIDSLSSTKLESLVRSKDNYVNAKYQSYYIKLNKVGIAQDVTFSTSTSYDFTFNLTDVEVKSGKPLTLAISINYATIFADISFPTMTDAEINTRIMANIPKSITLN